MRTLWKIIAVLAVANLIGLVLFVGWLKASDRLSLDRLRKVREIIAPTLSAEAEAAKTAEDQAKAAAKEKAEADRTAGPPESASDRIARNADDADAKEQAALRKEREQQDLARQLVRERQALDALRAQLEADRSAFEATRTKAAADAKSVQFKQALVTLESQKAKDAYTVLRALVDANKTELVVNYLAAMQDRTRAKVLAEFIKADEKMAAGLLDQLRSRGLASAAGGVRSGE
jgi:hypothetical protein